MRKINIVFILISIVLLGCDLDKSPRDTPDAEQTFGSEDGLEKYINSFYDMLPSASDITHGDELADNTSIQNVNDLLRSDVLNSRTTDRWDWGDLRNVNYFLQNNDDSEISGEIRKNFDGIARFYRALFYFEKVKRYGKAPWISKPLDLDSDKLQDPRDSRENVMDSVLTDIDYAIENIDEDNESSRTKITRDVALALKSRIALFEGTYRKYHNELDLGGSAKEWLEDCVDASEELMDEGGYNIYNGDGVEGSYKELFTSDQPIASSVILAHTFSEGQAVQHDANWYYDSGTYGVHMGFTRQFMNTFLMRDGTPFTDNDNYKTMTYTEEVKNRDMRLKQSIRMPDFTMTDSKGEEVSEPPNFSVTYSGYQPIKWIIPDLHYDDRDYNTNSVPIFRYAEVLLNYAEAKAELGTITDEDWSETVGELRRRAGITSGTNTLPTEIDPYMQNVYFPNISDPVILEIRRDRGIELSLENFRFDDIRRWKRGKLMEMDWLGIYVEANTPMDLTGNGEPDVYFYTDKEPENKESGVKYVDVGGSDLQLTEGDKGYLIRLPEIEKVWDDKKYLYPLNKKDIQKNDNLDQNPGW